MEHHLNFSDIQKIVTKERVSGIYCYETKGEIEINNVSELNESNSVFVSNDSRIQNYYKIIDYSVITLDDYKDRFNGSKNNCSSSVIKIMLVWVERK